MNLSHSVRSQWMIFNLISLSLADVGADAMIGVRRTKLLMAQQPILRKTIHHGLAECNFERIANLFAAISVVSRVRCVCELLCTQPPP